MQLVSSMIWTRITVFISYDDNHYTTGTFKSVDMQSFLNPYIYMTIGAHGF